MANSSYTPRVGTCTAEGCDRAILARRLCTMHYQRAAKNGLVRASEAERFWSKVERTGPHDCWLWTGTIAPTTGYGQFRLAGRGRLVLAHRYAYEVTVGPIPDGFEVDHVRKWGCTNRHCVNPAHLEAVTPWENNRRSNSRAAVNARRTHCIHGHPLEGNNLYVNPKGERHCRACARDRARKLRAS